MKGSTDSAQADHPQVDSSPSEKQAPGRNMALLGLYGFMSAGAASQKNLYFGICIGDMHFFFFFRLNIWVVFFSGWATCSLPTIVPAFAVASTRVLHYQLPGGK